VALSAHLCVNVNQFTTSNGILRLSRQKDATWASFHHQVSGINYNYDQLFPETVFQFLEPKAKSVGSSTGYLVPSLMTATSFLLRKTDTHFPNGNHIEPLTYTPCPLVIQEWENRLP